jgi:O-antigen chain-terminating methyltransferase
MFKAGGTVADVGFGQGFFLEAARAAGLRPIGVDRDERLVAEARARGFDARVADARDLGGVIGAVDGVMAAHLIEHLSPQEVANLLAAIAELVPSGGVVVLVTPNLSDWRVSSEWFWSDPTHVRPYPAGAVRQLIDPADWAWDGDGYEPMVITRHTPLEILNRLRFGSGYGRPGRWYRLRRTAAPGER